METTQVFTKENAIASLMKKAQHVITTPLGAKSYRVANNPITTDGGKTYFFNIDAMSSYHVAQAKLALTEGRHSDATKGFGVTIFENDFNQLPNIFKGGEVIVEIIEKANKQGVMSLFAKFIKANAVASNAGVDMRDEFASFLEDSSAESTDEPV